MSDASNPMLEQILSGENRQLQLLAARGVVPIPPEQLLPIQIGLTGSPDEEIATTARTALTEAEPERVARFASEHADETALGWLGDEHDHPTVLEAILRRRDVAPEILRRMASRLPPTLQETLVHRQDAILEAPGILVALEDNPELTSYAKRRIWEYREHLLPRDKVPPKAPEEVLAEAEALTDEEIQEAFDEARERHPDEGESTSAELRGMTDTQIRSLPVPMRIKLARGANLQMRQLLIRDPNAQVAMTVVTANTLSDQEVETIANSRSVVDEVLAEIPRRREWIRKYPILKAVVKNPKTRPGTAIRLISRLSVNDLRLLAKDRGVSEAVRGQALRLYQAKR